MMHISVISAGELTAEQAAIWSQIQRDDPTLESPYFRPEFTRAAADICPRVEVGLLESRDDVVGFFPFQRSRWNTARPVGSPMSDFHGLILRPGFGINAEELTRACGLQAWHFDHVLAEQNTFRPYHCHVSASPYMDLAGGFDAYCASRKAAGSNVIKQVRRKARQLERACGPLRCELHADAETVFEKLLEWKSNQYRRTGVPDVFRYRWTVSLLQRVLQERSDSFSGMLSALYAGERLAAVDLGLRSYGALHSWFPAYDPELRKFSPGNVLLLRVAEAAPSIGVQRIHLGKGSEAYKARFMSGEIALAEGTVENGALRRVVRRNWYRAREWARSSTLRSALPTRMLTPLREWIALRP